MTLSFRSDWSSLISRIAVTGKPSFSVSIRMRFSATCRPVCVLRALYTFPNVPSPTWLTISYSSPFAFCTGVCARVWCPCSRMWSRGDGECGRLEPFFVASGSE
jgi:hypothetical protein